MLAEILEWPDPAQHVRHTSGAGKWTARIMLANSVDNLLVFFRREREMKNVDLWTVFALAIHVVAKIRAIALNRVATALQIVSVAAAWIIESNRGRAIRPKLLRHHSSRYAARFRNWHRPRSSIYRVRRFRKWRKAMTSALP